MLKGTESKECVQACELFMSNAQRIVIGGNESKYYVASERPTRCRKIWTRSQRSERYRWWTMAVFPILSQSTERFHNNMTPVHIVQLRVDPMIVLSLCGTASFKLAEIRSLIVLKSYPGNFRETISGALHRDYWLNILRYCSLSRCTCHEIFTQKKQTRILQDYLLIFISLIFGICSLSLRRNFTSRHDCSGLQLHLRIWMLYKLQFVTSAVAVAVTRIVVF